MKLIQFRVRNFRSVTDSGWIESDGVTTLVGVNEAGKSNLLLALWKLNPAKDGEINKLDDMPRNKYSEWRDDKNPPVFIECEFFIENRDLINDIKRLSGSSTEEIRTVKVNKDFENNHYISFPKFNVKSSFPADEIRDILHYYKSQLKELEEKGVTEKGIKEKLLSLYQEAEKSICSNDSVTDEELKEIIEKVDISYKDLKKSVIQPHLRSLILKLSDLYQLTKASKPESHEEVRELIIESMPKFVYYSNYGNLDSEIYLPHVIENLEREDLSSVMAAKVRTLKVLFEFVNLNPKEILELGTETKLDSNKREVAMTEEELAVIAEKKSERDILLQSAGLNLTEKFRVWWKQGDYKFRFQADGKHFKIWVSDDKRPEEIALEGRSTGLQWFLSFYLIFLVESKDSHENAILLLDEAGVSLHPLAQKDLAHFFDNLSRSNQIIHTTHSPFLVDTGNVDRVKVVYLDEDGKTVASSDLRAADGRANKNTSVYAVHAALGLSVSDILLQGCKIVIVEGPSDQFYLNGIKNYLINKGLFQPEEEVVFVPSGGVKGIRPLSSLLSGKEEELPVILIDSDSAGKGMKKSLMKDLYKDFPDRIIEVEDILGIEKSEVEDLIPVEFIERYISRYSRGTEVDFFEKYKDSKALLPQLEAYFRENGIDLPVGWKVDLARNIKMNMSNPRLSRNITNDVEKMWRDLFQNFI